MPYHLAELQQLKDEDRQTWAKLGDNFSVIRSGIPFTNLFVDQTLEQQIRDHKVAGGITGITQNESALVRYLLIAPELKRLVESFKTCYTINNPKAKKMHHQLTGSMASRLQRNATKINVGILQHCNGNPFSVDTGLMNIASNMAVSSTAEKDIVERDKKGEAAFKIFVANRLVKATAKISMWDPVKKLSLRSFANWQKKERCIVNKKVIKLREDRQLLARFLVIQRSRPELLQKLNDVIGKYKFSTIPRSVFSTYGQLFIPTDKRAFVKPLESHVDAADLAETATEQSAKRICIIDVMAEFAKVFTNIIKNILDNYEEGLVIFDRYIENSLKFQTRVKGNSGTAPIKFQINDETNIKNVPLKIFLSHVEAKSQLTKYLGEILLREYHGSRFLLIVVYGTTTYSNRPAVFSPTFLHHNHEEADTIISLHVLDALDLLPYCNIYVRSPDTDIFVMLIDLCASHELAGRINFVTGQGKFHRSIEVKRISAALGDEKSKALIGLHSISGADWGGKFLEFPNGIG